MEQFNTQEKVLEIFKRANATGNVNCCFVALKDLTRLTDITIIGPVGIIKGENIPYDGVIINKTENGIALQYLKNKKTIYLKVNLDTFEIIENQCHFIENNDIVELTVKNHSFLNKKIKSIIIRTSNGNKHCLLANVNEPLLPYHNENLQKFINMYNS